VTRSAIRRVRWRVAVTGRNGCALVRRDAADPTVAGEDAVTPAVPRRQAGV